MADILIIDDHEAIRRSLRKILEALGHTVREAADGQTALRHFAGKPADLVFTDIFMPGMDGIEFLTRVREAFPEARIIAMSGGGLMESTGVLKAASALGAVAVLQKPMDVETIRAAVEGAFTGA